MVALYWLTDVRPAGQPLPTASLLNSLDGRAKANAAIVASTLTLPMLRN
jgi:hypothetical protein